MTSTINEMQRLFIRLWAGAIISGVCQAIVPSDFISCEKMVLYMKLNLILVLAFICMINSFTQKSK